MSWLFSQALVAEFSPAFCSDGAPSAPLNVMPTPHPFWSKDKTIDTWPRSLFGLTCAVLTPDRGADLLTSFLAASRANRSALPVNDKERTTSETCGQRRFEAFAVYDHNTHGWKTSPDSKQPKRSLSSLYKKYGNSIYLGKVHKTRSAGESTVSSKRLSDVLISDEFLGTWPSAGTMRSGVCWERTTSARRTSENESGFWPTPNASDAEHGGPNSTFGRGTPHLASAVHQWPTPRSNERGTYQRDRGIVGKERPTLTGAVRYPTPTASDYTQNKNPQSGAKARLSLVGMARYSLWPTPTVNDAHNNGAPSQRFRHTPPLNTMVHGGNPTPPMYPTPTAVNDTGGASLSKFGGTGARRKIHTLLQPEEINGALNPAWVEWLMGWPIGWTDLQPLETDRFQAWLQAHS